MPAELSAKQKKYLKAAAHRARLKPLVQVGKEGLHPGVFKSLEDTLKHHELVKVRIACEDRDEFQLLTQELVEGSGATLVGTIGRIATLYQQNPEKMRYSLPMS